MSFLYSQSLVALLSALKVQSTSLSYAGIPCKTGDKYWRIAGDCSATNDSSQCDARADGLSKSESKMKTIY